MAKSMKTLGSTNEQLKGNVMLGRKITLQRYENLSVNLLVEFYLNESDHVKEASKLTGAIDSIVELAKRRWS
jgi:hypothetical protein